MKLPLPNSARSGHSLIELIAATTCATILLAGLGSVMFIARQIAYTPTASEARIEAAVAVNQLVDELRFASWIVERSTDSIEFVVADRDGDGVAERIRYEWSGAAGDPLERTYNGGTPVAVAEGVDDFELSYLVDEKTVQLTPYSDSAETKLLSNETVAGSSERSVSSGLYVSQQINAGGFASVPASAASWNATRADFYGRNSGSTTETLLLQLRSSGNPYYGPSSEALGNITVAESSISGGAGWNSFSFASPIRGLSLTGRYNLVWASSNGSTACRLIYADTTASGVSESTDSGASWQYMTARQVYYRLWGTYSTAGTPIDVTRSYLTSVTVMLQADDALHSRIDASVPLANEPELVSAVWRADFEPDQPDPTAIDVAGDGDLDWAMSDGSNFDEDTVDQGMWSVNGTLKSLPNNDFTGVTTIEARCRDGAVLRINADRQAGTHGPLIVRVTSSSGMQTLSLNGETAAITEKTLASIEQRSTDWVRFQLLIVPQQNVVRLTVQGREVGAYTYPTYATATTDRCISLSGAGAKFDFVEARVSSEAVVEVVN
jgi:hypothetical protein